MDWFLLCILARLNLSYIAYAHPWLHLALLVFLVGVASVWILMSIGVIQRDTGPEAGGEIWWKDLRVFHAALYLLASIRLYFGDGQGAALILLLDVALGSAIRYAYRASIA